MSQDDNQAPIGWETVALLACMMSLPALSTDIMIPGLNAMAQDLKIVPANDAQWIVTAIFFGLVPGQLFFGPLADSVGRKPAMLLGLGITLLGTLATIAAPSFTWLLVGRAIQGFGVAAPRTLTLAMIRDRYSGARMARIVSNVMGVFACIPMIAPVIGQVILFHLSWRWIFGAVFLFSAALFPWFGYRQPETLARESRSGLSPHKLVQGFLAVAGNRVVLWYAVGTGLLFAGFITYMTTAPQVFQKIYDTGNAFGFWFAFIGLGMVVASYVNGRWVERLGMRRICRVGLLTVLLASGVLAAWMWGTGAKPGLSVVVAYFLLIMLVEGALYSNLFALAMEPLDRSAGMGATIVSTVSMLVSVPIGMAFASGLSDSILPLIAAFATFSVMTLGVMWLAEAGGSGRAVDSEANEPA